MLDDMTKSAPSLDDYVKGVRAGDRAVLGRAITLVESTKPAHRALARDLLQALMPYTGQALRIGITGVPGVGKSTAIDQLGVNLIAAGRRVAVLAVDPTSKRSGGSILGDKTRMTRLSADEHAFIRPSPTSGTLGGVTAKTRETMALVEAAGFDTVIVETVGVGQSEVAVADMVDFFLVLLLAGGGDDLQGIKKGVIELADMIAINKADGDNVARADQIGGRLPGRAQHPDATLEPVAAAGDHHLGRTEHRPRPAVGAHRAPPLADAQVRRIRGAPQRPGGRLDARPDRRTAARRRPQQSERHRGLARGRGAGQGRRIAADACRRRNPGADRVRQCRR